ncbi:MAG: hypothetical protein CMJ89_10485 [Planctomycetes bacterium]|nr:hypothetical protein [Planctomycetota bacterium]
MLLRTLTRLSFLLTLGVPGAAQHEFWNFETPHVHPLEITPDGERLLAVNTPDQRLEVFNISTGVPVHVLSAHVGLEPVSVRARTSTEAWVINHLSDSVTVLDPQTGKITKVLKTDDEPCDVAFSEGRAFVTCSQANTVLVFNTFELTETPQRIHLDGEDPRGIAAGSGGAEIYVAFFESGNETTILGGGFALPSPPIASNAVSDPDGPYGGINPPPNDGIEFNPPMSDNLPPAPEVGLIVRRDAEDRWWDDNEMEWTEFVSGPLAGRSGRVPDWQLLDHDVAVIQAQSLDVSYVGGLMNLCMAMAVHPSGAVHVVGTDARNHERFEPVLNGRFLEVLCSSIQPGPDPPVTRFDLNPHIDSEARSVPQEERDLSIGDPRGIVWSSDGSFGFVAGLGSNNVVKLDEEGQRAAPLETIEVGEGPTGLALNEVSNLLYVLNKFSASITVVDLSTSRPDLEIPFFDPTTPEIKIGRKHLYDTHETSGTGVASCASCHADARTDKLVWDLGNPAGEVKLTIGQNLASLVTEDWHPMKGPMATQTLQDIIGKEPLHWRGDRAGIEEFNGAFASLMADDEVLTPTEMQEFEDFLATIRIPPNPYRNLDNTLSESVPLPGQFTSGSIGPQGLPLPPGNAVRGLDIFVDPDPEEVSCVSCHALPSGVGTDHHVYGETLVPFPVGPNGEHHSRLVHLDGFTNHTLKPAQLRTLYEHIGFDLRQPAVHVGFGFLHDGSIDSLSSFLAPFGIASGFFTDQDVADTIAFLMSLSGSELPEGSLTTLNRPPGMPSLDSHAAIGHQIFLDGGAGDSAEIELLSSLFDLADEGKIGVVAHGYFGGVPRGFYYLGNNALSSDRQYDRLGATGLFGLISPQNPLVWTVVPANSAVRMGVDRDGDGVFDRDEIDNGTGPDDPSDFPCLYEPYPPAAFTAVHIRRQGADFEWQDESFNEEGFHIQYRVQGQANFITIATTGPNTTFARVSGLNPDTHYQFRLVGFNCAGLSHGDHLSLSTLADRPFTPGASPQGTRSRSL